MLEAGLSRKTVMFFLVRKEVAGNLGLRGSFENLPTSTSPLPHKVILV